VSEKQHILRLQILLSRIWPFRIQHRPETWQQYRWRDTPFRDDKPDLWLSFSYILPTLQLSIFIWLTH